MWRQLALYKGNLPQLAPNNSHLPLFPTDILKNILEDVLVDILENILKDILKDVLEENYD